MSSQLTLESVKAASSSGGKKNHSAKPVLPDLRPEDNPTISRNALKEAYFAYAVPRYMDQEI